VRKAYAIGCIWLFVGTLRAEFAPCPAAPSKAGAVADIGEAGANPAMACVNWLPAIDHSMPTCPELAKCSATQPLQISHLAETPSRERRAAVQAAKCRRH